MGKPVRTILSTIAGTLGYEVNRRPPMTGVLSVMAMLRPFSTGLPLVRLGGDADGGYLVPDDIAGISTCLSPGVADSAHFEAALERRGISSLLVDGSVEGPPAGCEHMPFERKFLGLVDSETSTTLESWVGRWPQAAQGDLLLQMDIEGAEWLVLASTAESLLRRFRIMVIELHGLDALRQPFGLRVMHDVLERLHRDFVCVHLHPNNNEPVSVIGGVRVPQVMEATFLRRDRVRLLAPREDFPHPLDRDNVPGKASVHLPPEWFTFHDARRLDP